MVTAFNEIQFNNIGVRNADRKLQNENMDAASDLFTGMLGCARTSRSETMNTGHISLTGGMGQSSNKGHATNCSKLLGQNVKTALCEDGLKTDRSFPGQTDLRPTDNGAAKSNTTHLQMSPDPGMIKPEAALGVQGSKQIQAVFGKNGLVEETDTVSGETVKSGLRKSKPTTSVFGKNETAAKMPIGSEKKITGNKNSAANLPDADLKQTRLAHQRHGPGNTAKKNAKTPTGSEKKINSDKNSAANLPDADLKQTRLAHQRHGPGNTPENQNFNIETAPPVKSRTTGKHGRGKNDSITPLKGDEGEKAVGVKWRHSDPNGEKIIFEPEKTAARDIFNHTMENISKKISGPVQSIDHELSIGGNHAGPLHSGHSASVAETTTNSGIDARALINQVAEQARKAGRIRIVLTPPRMGTLDMDVVVRDNKVQVILKAENNDVWHALKSNMTSLETALRNQGLMVDTIQVSVQEKFGDNNFGFGQNGAAFKEDSNQENNPGPHQGEPDAIEYGLTGSPEEMTGDRMDGRISLFI
jgi:flagellar hook-length control protein FliK